MITVLVADDHELVRSGIEYILDTVPEITVVGTAATAEAALELADSLRPDIVIMDVNMPGLGGLAACQKLKRRHPEIRLIALSVYADGPIPRQLIEAGVDGYLSKHCPPQEMIKAVKTVHRGDRYLSQDVANRLIFAEKSATPFDRLSSREMEVALLTLQGKSIQEIAAILSVSPKTVCTYRYRIFEKLGIRNDVELTRLAAKYGLLKEDVG